MTTSIEVRHRQIDDWHVFTSTDLPGLYVANKDAKTAFNDVSTAIEKLLLLDSNMSVAASPEMEFSQFINRVEDQDAESPFVLSDKRYIIREAMAA
jgi:hypothetical protein